MGKIQFQNVSTSQPTLVATLQHSNWTLCCDISISRHSGYNSNITTLKHNGIAVQHCNLDWAITEHLTYNYQTFPYPFADWYHHPTATFVILGWLQSAASRWETTQVTKQKQNLTLVSLRSLQDMHSNHMQGRYVINLDLFCNFNTMILVLHFSSWELKYPQIVDVWSYREHSILFV